jgi:L-lactate utilization protein LutB
MDTRQKYYYLLAQQLLAEFQKRGLEGFYCATKGEALNQVLELIPRDAIVSCGGSATLAELGLPLALQEGGYHILNPSEGKSAVEMDVLAHQALGADYFLLSANAIAASGELVNADGYGNRVSALIFGPTNVIVIAGMNKVVADLPAAISRAKHYASQMIMLRFKPDYPSYTDLEQAALTACNQLVITSGSAVKGRIKVVLVGEELGF